jgi:hypothetical protein
MRFRESQLSWHILKESDNEQLLIHYECNIAKSFNFVAETVNCRLLISCVLILELTNHKTTYNNTNEFFLLLVHSIQETDALVQVWKAKTAKMKCSYWVRNLKWIFNSIELLHCENNYIYHLRHQLEQSCWSVIIMMNWWNTSVLSEYWN